MYPLNLAPSNGLINGTGPACAGDSLNNLVVDFGQQVPDVRPELDFSRQTSTGTSSSDTSPSTRSSIFDYSSHTSTMSLDKSDNGSLSVSNGHMTTRSQVNKSKRSESSLPKSINSLRSVSNAADTLGLKTSEDEIGERPRPPPKKKRAPHGGAKQTQRAKGLERNRLAPSKCRQRKKEWSQELEFFKAALENQRNNLRSEYAGLSEEITRLKNLLLSHAGCNDPKVDNWINDEAAQFVQRSQKSQHSNTSPSGSDGAFCLSPDTATEYFPCMISQTPLSPTTLHKQNKKGL